jgi:hypothetical protein
MTQTLGPYTPTSTPALTPGSAFAISVPYPTQAVQIHNDSPYRIYLQIDGDMPTSATATNATYDGLASPWAHPVIPLQRHKAGGYQPFNGVLWFMVVDPTSVLAQTGSVSQLVEMHLDCYFPDESWPQAWSIPRQHDITSQPRTVVVPTSIAHFYNNSWNGVGTSLVATLVPNAAQLAAGFAPIYLYYAHMFPRAAVSGITECAIQADFRDGGGVSISTVELVRGSVYYDTATHAATDWTFAPTWPYGLVGPLPANTVTVRINVVQIIASPIALDFTIAVSMDFVNISGTSEIGQTPFNAASQPRF